MALRLVISGLLSLILIYSSSYYIVCSFICNYFIVRRLRVCISVYYNLKVILAHPKNFPNHPLIEFFFTAIFICACFIPFIFGFIVDDFVRVNLQMLIITLCIWSGIFFLKKLTDSEVIYLSSINNLTLGYGVAIWYYKNYLERILPNHFLMRVKQHETKEGIRLPHKLYILCPKSCKIKQYIDKTDNIEYTKDLPPYEIDHGGIKRREYNISVYRIESNEKIFYCALEYAQPLKTLRALKENGRISSSEMYIERESFIKNLMLMLRDRENSFEVCELVEYNDENAEIHDLLAALPSIQEYKQQAVE